MIFELKVFSNSRDLLNSQNLYWHYYPIYPMKQLLLAFTFCVVIGLDTPVQITNLTIIAQYTHITTIESTVSGVAGLNSS